MRPLLIVFYAVLIGAAFLMSGCQRTEDPSVASGGISGTREAVAAPVAPISDYMLLLTDPETGCEYFMPKHGTAGTLTPRTAWGGSGMYQVGCKGTVKP